MEAVAKLKNVPIPPRKMRYVVDLIRGKSIEDALNILRFNKRVASEWCEKLLLSAIANWEQKSDMTLSADDYKLYIKEIFVDGGTMLKRIRPAPHGRAHRIRKRSNHVTLVVENGILLEDEEFEEEYDEEYDEEYEEEYEEEYDEEIEEETDEDSGDEESEEIVEEKTKE